MLLSMAVLKAVIAAGIGANIPSTPYIEPTIQTQGNPVYKDNRVRRGKKSRAALNGGKPTFKVKRRVQLKKNNRKRA